MAETLTTMDALVKELYVDGRVIQNLAEKENPFLGMVPKMTKAEGDQVVVPLRYGTTNMRSHTVATALTTNTGAGKRVKFNVTLIQDYAGQRVSRQLIKATESNKGAFTRAVTECVDDAMLACSRNLGQELFRSVSGSKGQISSDSSVGSSTITLANISDAQNFQVGEFIQLSSADGTGSLRNSGDDAEITGVDEDLGTLTFAGALTAEIAAAAAGDYIFKSGDHTLGLSGLAGWIPASAPGATTFFGVARNVDAVKLGGNRLNATATSNAREEDLLTLIAKIRRSGGRPDVCFVGHDTFSQITRSLQGQNRYASGMRSGTTAGIGFESIKLYPGSVDVVADHNCPENRAYVLQLDTWELLSLGDCPHVFDDDGYFDRIAGVDSYEVRVGYYAQLSCNAPGRNGVVVWS